MKIKIASIIFIFFISTGTAMATTVWETFETARIIHNTSTYANTGLVPGTITTRYEQYPDDNYFNLNTGTFYTNINVGAWVVNAQTGAVVEDGFAQTFVAENTGRYELEIRGHLEVGKLRAVTAPAAGEHSSSNDFQLFVTGSILSNTTSIANDTIILHSFSEDIWPIQDNELLNKIIDEYVPGGEYLTYVLNDAASAKMFSRTDFILSTKADLESGKTYEWSFVSSSNALATIGGLFWGGNASSAEMVYVIDKVSVIYSPITVTTSSGPNGSISPSTTVNPSDSVTLTAFPNTGYTVDSWYENGEEISGNEGDLSILLSDIQEDATILVTFKSTGSGSQIYVAGSLTPNSISFSLAAGGSGKYYDIPVQNRGSSTDTVNATLTGDAAGWASMTSSNSSFTLAPNETKISRVSVFAPDNASAGAHTLNVSYNGTTITFSILVTVPGGDYEEVIDAGSAVIGGPNWTVGNVDIPTNVWNDVDDGFYDNIRLYAHVDSVSTGGTLSLYDAGFNYLMSTAGINPTSRVGNDISWPISKYRLNKLDNTFGIAAPAGTDLQLSNFRFIITFYTAGTDIKVTKSLVPQTAAVGENITVTVTAENFAEGSTTGFAVELTDSLPSGISLVSGSLNDNDFGDLEEVEMRSNTYTIVANQPGYYTLPSARLAYESINGDALADESIPVELFVTAGQLIAELDIKWPENSTSGDTVFNALVKESDGVIPVLDASLHGIIQRDNNGTWEAVYTVPMGWAEGNQNYTGLMKTDFLSGGVYRAFVVAQKDLYTDGQSSMVEWEAPLMVSVPSLAGKNQAQSESDILSASLTVGAITTANSDTVPAGEVISQSPVSGSFVVIGSAVDIVISLGSLPPSITIDRPLDDATVQNLTTSYEFSGTASDSDGTVTKVEYRLRSESWLTAIGTTNWDFTTGLESGSNLVELRAQDNSGVYSTIISRTITREDVDTDDDGILDGNDAFPLDATPIPDGISIPPTDDDISGIKRQDMGDKYSNEDNDKPRADLEYLFEIVIKDTLGNSPTKVRVVINGQAIDMALTAGNLTDGALYSVTLKLGPVGTHDFYYEALDDSGSVVYLYPDPGDLPGPVVELLNGPNMLGLAKDMSASSLGLVELFDSNSIYQWVSDGVTTDTNNGSFEALDNSSSHTPGKGYFVVRKLNATLPDLTIHPETFAPAVVVDLSPGWNIISNPYGSHFTLSDIQVQRGDGPVVTWTEACTNRWLTNSIYTYLGSDWGSSYTFESAGGDPDAVLTPWIGYWVYVIRNDADYKLIFTKP